MSMRSVLRRRNRDMIEQLESRTMLSVSVVAEGSTLTIRGDSAGQRVELFESHTALLRQTLVRLDADGNGNFSDPGDVNGAAFSNITSVVIRLGLGDDRVDITLADPVDGASKSYDTKTGAGNDVVSYTNPVGNDLRNSTFAAAVDTAGGDDRVALAINRVIASSFSAAVNTGAGNDVLSTYGGDDIVDSSVNISGSTGAGADRVDTSLDWEGFDVIGAQSVWRTSILGGDGDDVMTATGFAGNSAADVSGRLDIGYFGEAGNDQISFALDRFNLRGGTLRLRGNGGLGDDAISLAGEASGIGGGVIDVALKGAAGNDNISVNANASGVSYAPADGIVLDGGADVDSAAVSGTILYRRVNLES